MAKKTPSAEQLHGLLGKLIEFTPVGCETRRGIVRRVETPPFAERLTVRTLVAPGEDGLLLIITPAEIEGQVLDGRCWRLRPEETVT
jgi:hypothetical protein